MSKSILSACVLFAAGASLLAIDGTVLAQGGTAPQSESMGGSRSGSAIDPDKGSSTSPDSHTKKSFDEGFTGQPSGLGEKGSGQSQSTMERSGGQQGHQAQGQSQSPSEPKEGKTAQAMEEQLEQKSQ
jgi:hypothetical protein